MNRNKLIMALNQVTGTPADWAMTPEKFLADDTPPPIDEDEIREALYEALQVGLLVDCSL